MQIACSYSRFNIWHYRLSVIKTLLLSLTADSSFHHRCCSIVGPIQPILTCIVEVRILCSSQIIGELLDSQLCSRHGHRIRNHATNTARAALVVDDLGPVLWLPAGHRRLIRSGLWLLELNVSGNVVRLSSEEILFVLLGVEDWCIELFHLLLPQDELAKIFTVRLSLYCKPGLLRRFGPIDVLGLHDHFVKSGYTISLSSSKYTVLIGNGRC